jgi:hypothetical protein
MLIPIPGSRFLPSQIPEPTATKKRGTKTFTTKIIGFFSTDALKDLSQFTKNLSSVADPDPVPFRPLDPGSRIGFFRIPNPYL